MNYKKTGLFLFLICHYIHGSSPEFKTPHTRSILYLDKYKKYPITHFRDMKRLFFNKDGQPRIVYFPFNQPQAILIYNPKFLASDLQKEFETINPETRYCYINHLIQQGIVRPTTPAEHSIRTRMNFLPKNHADGYQLF